MGLGAVVQRVGQGDFATLVGAQGVQQGDLRRPQPVALVEQVGAGGGEFDLGAQDFVVRDRAGGALVAGRLQQATGDGGGLLIDRDHVAREQDVQIVAGNGGDRLLNLLADGGIRAGRVEPRVAQAGLDHARAPEGLREAQAGREGLGILAALREHARSVAGQSQPRQGASARRLDGAGRLLAPQKGGPQREVVGQRQVAGVVQRERPAEDGQSGSRPSFIGRDGVRRGAARVTQVGGDRRGRRRKTPRQQAGHCGQHQGQGDLHPGGGRLDRPGLAARMRPEQRQQTGLDACHALPVGERLAFPGPDIVKEAQRPLDQARQLRRRGFGVQDSLPDAFREHGVDAGDMLRELLPAFGGRGTPGGGALPAPDGVIDMHKGLVTADFIEAQGDIARHGLPRPIPQRLDFPAKTLDHVVQDAVGHGEEELFLAGEEVVDRPRGELRRGGDRLDRRGLVAPGREDALGGIENLAAVRLALPHAAAGSGVGLPAHG